MGIRGKYQLFSAPRRGQPVSLCEDHVQLNLSNLVRPLPSVKGHGALFLGGGNVSAEIVQTAFIAVLNGPLAKVLSVKEGCSIHLDIVSMDPKPTLLSSDEL